MSLILQEIPGPYCSENCTSLTPCHWDGGWGPVVNAQVKFLGKVFWCERAIRRLGVVSKE